MSASSTKLAEIDARVETFVKNSKDREGLAKAYDNWAANGLYDQDLEDLGYIAKLQSPCQTLEDNFGGKPLDVLEVLDVACGSGLVGVELHRRGFRKIDGLDPSPGMLDHAKEKGVYRNFIQTFVDETPSKLLSADKYDAVTCFGGVAGGHLPSGAMHEMMRVAKPGGLILIVGNQHHYETDPEYCEKMEGIMKKYVSEGKMEIIKRDVVTNYRQGADAVSILMKKLK